MLVVYQTQIINGTTYITGWSACSPDASNAVELNSQLQMVLTWLDDKGNPFWVLNPDGSVVYQPITVGLTVSTAIAKKTISDQQTTLNSIMVDIVHNLVNGKAVPKALLAQWNQAYAAIQAAYGSVPGLTK